MFFGRIYGLFALLSILPALTNASVDGYDEVFNSDGQLRSVYQQFNEAFQTDVTQPKKSLVSALLHESPLDDANRIYPIPLVLEAEEIVSLRYAAMIRALALRRFFYDLMNKQKFLQDKQMKGPSLELLEKIAIDSEWPLDELKKIWRGKRFKDISFLFGPDFIRDAEGEWHVIEDNVGNIGGFYDFDLILNAYLSSLTGAKRLSYHFEGMEAFHMLLEVYPNLKKSVLATPEKIKSFNAFEDSESTRRVHTLGIVYDGPKTPDEILNLFQTEAPKNLLNFDLSFEWAPSREMLLNLFQNHNVRLLNAPGTEILSHKSLLPFVDWMIDFYLPHMPPPSIKTQPTINLELPENYPMNARETHLSGKYPSYERDVRRPGRRRQIFEDFPIFPEVMKSGWVLKKANENQGSSVYLLDDLEDHQLAHVATELNDEIVASIEDPKKPFLWVLQQRLDPSFVRPTFQTPSWHSYQVNLRVHGVLGYRGLMTASFPWGRAQTPTHSLINNVSRGALHIPVLEKDVCRQRLAGMAGWFDRFRDK